MKQHVNFEDASVRQQEYLTSRFRTGRIGPLRQTKSYGLSIVERFDFLQGLFVVLLISRCFSQHDHPPIFYLSGVHPFRLVIKYTIKALVT